MYSKSEGACVEVTDERGLVCKSGVVEISKLKLMPQFKLGADKESGVVHELKGDYFADHDPIRIFRDEKGELVVFSGRHRLDAAKRAGVKRIVAYVYDGKTEEWARLYDIELNIRDNQATALEVAMYVRGEFTGGEALTEEQVSSVGIAREGKLGAIGLRIGRNAGESVMDALRNGKIEDSEALAIADFAPGNENVQRKGLAILMEGGSKTEARERMVAELELAKMAKELGIEQGEDLFGNTMDNDAWLDYVAKYVVRRRNEITKDIQYLRTTATRKNAKAMAEKYGVDVKDPDGMKKALKEAESLRDRWKSPYTDAELMEEMKGAYRAEHPEGGEDSQSERIMADYARQMENSENPNLPDGVTHFSTSGGLVNESGEEVDLRKCYARTKSGDRLGRNVYIRTPMDNLNWFEFPKDEHVQAVLKKKGIKDLPIRLRVGKHASVHQGYGWMHILNHMGDMQEVGESPLMFLYNTLTNFVSMTPQSRGRYRFNAEKEYGKRRLLVVDLMEEDGCYSMVTCYPTYARIENSSELLIGRALFRFTHSNDRTRISHDTQPDEVATGAESTSGKAQAADNIASDPPAVNIYDIEVVDSKGSRVYSQPDEPTVHFSVIGERAETWEKYKDRAFKGRDDGMMRAELDASKAKLKDGVVDELRGAERGEMIGFLGEVLDFPELFEAYPWLQWKEVMASGGPGSSMFMSREIEKPIPKKGRIYLGVNKDGNVLGSLLHEVQHEVQVYEGFAAGVAGDDAVRRVWRDLGREDELKARPEQSPRLYLSTAGEIEARNVTWRMFMTEEDRRNKAFNDTLDVGAEHALRFNMNEYFAAMDAKRAAEEGLFKDGKMVAGNAVIVAPADAGKLGMTHFSVDGMRARTAGANMEASYVDPADGKRKFVIPVSGARLSTGFTPGQLNAPLGGHKDVSLGALLHYPELYQAYPWLADMRVRLYNPTEKQGMREDTPERVGGYFRPAVGDEAAYIAIHTRNAQAREGGILTTLLHESQHAIQEYEGHAQGAGRFTQEQAIRYLNKAIAQQEKMGVGDSWAQDNLRFLKGLREYVKDGHEDGPMRVYMFSRGEQEARYTGERREGEPMAGDGSGLSEGAWPNYATVGVRGEAKELGGVTFGGLSRFDYLLESRLAPGGEFNYDRAVYQMRDAIARRARELSMMRDGEGEPMALYGFSVSVRWHREDKGIAQKRQFALFKIHESRRVH